MSYGNKRSIPNHIKMSCTNDTVLYHVQSLIFTRKSLIFFNKKHEIGNCLTKPVVNGHHRCVCADHKTSLRYLLEFVLQYCRFI